MRIFFPSLHPPSLPSDSLASFFLPQKDPIFPPHLSSLHFISLQNQDLISLRIIKIENILVTQQSIAIKSILAAFFWSVSMSWRMLVPAMKCSISNALPEVMQEEIGYRPCTIFFSFFQFAQNFFFGILHSLYCY